MSIALRVRMLCLLGAVLAGGCALVSGSPLKRVPLDSLLLDRPPLPESYVVQLDIPGGRGPRAIGWKLVSPSRILLRTDCSPGSPEWIREWSDGGGLLGDPLAFETVCSFARP